MANYWIHNKNNPRKIGHLEAITNREGDEASQEETNQAKPSGNSTEENQLPENNDAADGDSAQNNQQSAEQAQA